MDMIYKYLVRYTNNEKEKKDLHTNIDIFLYDFKRNNDIQYIILRLGSYVLYIRKCQKDYKKMMYIRYFFSKSFYIHSTYFPFSLIKKNQQFTFEKVLKSGGYLFFRKDCVAYKTYKKYSNAKLITSCN